MSRIQKLFDLTGKSALVTGATGAFGEAVAKALAEAGAHVTIAGGNAEALNELAGSLKASGALVETIALRPSDATCCDQIVAVAADDGRGLDILVSASGSAIVKPILDMDDRDWDSVMDANAKQSWMLCRSAGRVFADQGRGGAVVLVSSVRSKFATAAGTSVYGASKAAVDMITRSLATEWGAMDVRVNAIAPTVFRSALTAWLYEDDAAEKRADVLKRIPLGRLAEPDDFAGSVVFLASKASGLITGHVLNVDGGFSAN
ncbi:MAG: SDR family NAD(P)-dependent oxidoreductase [Henriciella sp.]